MFDYTSRHLLRLKLLCTFVIMQKNKVGKYRYAPNFHLQVKKDFGQVYFFYFLMFVCSSVLYYRTS